MGEEINTDEDVLIECIINNIEDRTLRAVLKMQLGNDYSKTNLLRLKKWVDERRNKNQAESCEEDNGVSRIINKIDSFLNQTTRNNDNRKHNIALKVDKKCYQCGHGGHVARNCYSSSALNRQPGIKNEDMSKNSSKSTLEYIEKVGGFTITGTM